jgi:hypothetical protein
VRRVRWLWLVLLIGCGYRFTAGTPPLPDGIRSVQVPVFANRTAEIAVETAFTEAMRAQLDRAQALGGAGADATLQGEVRSITSSPIFDENNRLYSYRLSGTLRLRLLRASGQVVSAVDVSGSEDYLSGAKDDVLLSEANRREALSRLAQTLAEDGYRRIAAAD